MLPALDWSRPWFAPWRAAGEGVAARVAAGWPLDAALNEAGPAPVRFVPQDGLPAGTPYESFVFDTGRCPVRPGLHDFFNGLCWLRFPAAKSALNRLQAEAIARDGIGARRGPMRDAITLFDESGALLQAAPELWQALLARQWRSLFVELRPLWREARLLVFGHALLEQLAAPRRNITAHVWRDPCPPGDAADADAWLAAQLAPERLAAKPFTPLPVLGIPGWCAENENFSFYDDSLVFRPPRAPQASTTTTPPGPRRS
ncbi:MAG: DUF3025 domain-containing protein [Pseudomonadota bacterium]